MEKIDIETKEKINSLLALYEKNEGGWPIDFGIIVDSLAEIIDKDIELVEREYGKNKSGGHVWPCAGGFLIYLNISRDTGYQRFTLGHEIGHILHTFDCSKEKPEQRPDRSSTIFHRNPVEEDICDEISRTIICPPSRLNRMLKNFYRTPYQLELFRKKQKSAEIARLEIIARFFGTTRSSLIWCIKRQFNGFKIREILSFFKI